MRSGLKTGTVLTVGLLAACATGSREVRDENSERIEEAMRPEAHPEVIPEGISLADDAPPLAPAGPEWTSSPVMITSSDAISSPGWFQGPLPVIVPGPVWGPYPGPMRYQIEARPGGSIPGLLP